MGSKFIVGLSGMFVIGLLAIGSIIAAVIASGGLLFGTENRSFGDLSLTEQVISAGVIPVVILLAGVLPWWLGGFSFPQSLLFSVGVHAVTLGFGLTAQQPLLFVFALMLGWIVVPIVLSSDG